MIRFYFNRVAMLCMGALFTFQSTHAIAEAQSKVLYERHYAFDITCVLRQGKKKLPIQASIGTPKHTVVPAGILPLPLSPYAVSLFYTIDKKPYESVVSSAGGDAGELTGVPFAPSSLWYAQFTELSWGLYHQFLPIYKTIEPTQMLSKATYSRQGANTCSKTDRGSKREFGSKTTLHSTQDIEGVSKKDGLMWHKKQHYVIHSKTQKYKKNKVFEVRVSFEIEYLTPKKKYRHGTLVCKVENGNVHIQAQQNDHLKGNTLEDLKKLVKMHVERHKAHNNALVQFEHAPIF